MTIHKILNFKPTEIYDNSQWSHWRFCQDFKCILSQHKDITGYINVYLSHRLTLLNLLNERDKIAKPVFYFLWFWEARSTQWIYCFVVVFPICKTKHLFIPLPRNTETVVLILQQEQSYKRFCLPSDHHNKRNETIILFFGHLLQLFIYYLLFIAYCFHSGISDLSHYVFTNTASPGLKN